jgi:hypothetical protein
VEKKCTEEARPSVPTWEDLESCLRSKLRGWLEDMLEAEADELSAAVGRGVGGPSARRLATGMGTGSPECKPRHRARFERAVPGGRGAAVLEPPNDTEKPEGQALV